MALNGIENQEDGKIFTLYNASTANITIANNSGSASAGQKILTPNGLSLAVLPGRSVIFQYENTLTQWIIIGGSALPSSSGSYNTAKRGCVCLEH